MGNERHNRDMSVRQQLSILDMLDEICTDHDVSIWDLRSSRRSKSAVAARREFYSRATAAGCSSEDIGSYVNKDPSTIRNYLLKQRSAS